VSSIVNLAGRSNYFLAYIKEIKEDNWDINYDPGKQILFCLSELSKDIEILEKKIKLIYEHREITQNSEYSLQNNEYLNLFTIKANRLRGKVIQFINNEANFKQQLDDESPEIKYEIFQLNLKVRKVFNSNYLIKFCTVCLRDTSNEVAWRSFCENFKIRLDYFIKNFAPPSCGSKRNLEPPYLVSRSKRSKIDSNNDWV